MMISGQLADMRNNKGKVDGFVRELTFERRLGEYVLRDKLAELTFPAGPQMVCRGSLLPMSWYKSCHVMSSYWCKICQICQLPGVAPHRGVGVAKVDGAFIKVDSVLHGLF